MKFTQAKTRKGKHALVHGMPKVGKSQLVGKLAEAGYRLWWFSTDGGHGVLAKLPLAAQERIELISLPDTRAFPIASNTVRKALAGGKHRICDAHGQINCSVCSKDKESTWVEFDINSLTDNDIVVIDHISGVAESVINAICAKDFQKNDTYKFSWDDYRSQGSVMHDILSNVQHSHANIVCIAHTLEVTSEDKSKILVPEVGTRNFSDTVGKYFDHVVYLHILNNGHRAGSSTTYRAGVLTGSRGDVAVEALTADIKNPAILAPLFNPLIVGQAQEIADKNIQTLTSIATTKVEAEVVEDPEPKEITKPEETKAPEPPASPPTSEAVTAAFTAIDKAEAEQPMSASERMKLMLAKLKENK